MDKIKKEDLEKLKTDIDTCIRLVKEISANYDSKIHYPILTQSVVSSVNNTVGTIIRSTDYLEGYHIMCDEINPIALTDYLFKLRKYAAGKEVVSYYVAFYLKRKINEFYREIKKGDISMGIAMLKDKKSLKKYYNDFYDRAANGLKILRSEK